MTRTEKVACNLCEAICGLEITLEDDRVTRIAGDPDDPLSRGHICPKAVALQDIQSDPDRLRHIEEAVRTQYATQSDPYYATSRLWDDGIIEPAQTRDVLGLCLSVINSTPDPTGFSPVYRM